MANFRGENGLFKEGMPGMFFPYLDRFENLYGSYSSTFQNNHVTDRIKELQEARPALKKFITVPALVVLNALM